jgi:hypothetical protein
MRLGHEVGCLNFQVEKRGGSPYRTHIACRKARLATRDVRWQNSPPMFLQQRESPRNMLLIVNLPIAVRWAGAWIICSSRIEEIGYGKQ